MDDDRSGNMPDPYDRAIGSLTGLPDVVHSRPSTIRVVEPVLGHSQVYIVQTYRQKEQGDTIFLETMGRAGSLRIVIPPKVVTAIMRQHDALTTKNRSETGKKVAQERKDRGEEPAFMRNRDKRRPSKKR